MSSEQLEGRDPGTPARRTIPFRGFNFQANVKRGQGKPENWEQPAACYFVTFRPGDSIPSDVFAKWRGERRVDGALRDYIAAIPRAAGLADEEHSLESLHVLQTLDRQSNLSRNLTSWVRASNQRN